MYGTCTAMYRVAQKSKLLTQYNSLLFFEPPCIWNSLSKTMDFSRPTMIAFRRATSDVDLAEFLQLT